MDPERVIVRRFATDDLTDFLAYQGDPAVRRYLKGEAMTPEQAATYLATQAVLDEGKREAWHGYAVEHLADGRVIGDVGVWLPAQGPGDVGFQFDPRYHGQGYAFEAMQAFLPYAFRTFDLPAITATCDSANTASAGLMKRLGMHLVHETDGELQYGLDRRRTDVTAL